VKNNEPLTIQEVDLSDPAGFFSSMAGNPYQDRGGSSYNAPYAGLSIGKIWEGGMKVVTATESVATIEHKLGYAPLVIGSFRFNSTGGWRVIGDTVNPQGLFDGRAYVKKVDKKIVQFAIMVDYGWINDDVKFKIYLLENAFNFKK